MKFLTNSGAIGLYLHIPFCTAKCNYCDFYSMRFDRQQGERYINALLSEIVKWGGQTNRPISSVYIGGGTPSVLGANNLCTLINAVKASFTVLSDAEITVEVNPQSSSGELFSALFTCGVNRISIGVQSGNDDELKTLGRAHNVALAEQTFLSARKAGFDNISLDLMLGLPNSNAKTLGKTLDLFLRLSPQHISAYILKIEENTPFYKTAKALNLPNEDEICSQYEQVCAALAKNGYEHYEISNFCKSGRHGKHNINYWNCGEYLGIGPAAHSFLNGERFFYERDLCAFLQNPKAVSDGTGGDRSEYFMLKLRLSDGLDLNEFKQKYNINDLSLFLKKARLFEKGGLVRLNDNTLSLTEKGMLVSNTIIVQLEGSL